MSEHRLVFGHYTAEEIEAQYDLRARRPDFDATVLSSWIERSGRARAELGGTLDIAYGSSERQKLDFFSADRPGAPTLVYFHGGYWQRGDKSIYSFLAPAFVERGVNMLMVGYDLCPAVSIATIVDQARRALIWIWRNEGALGIARDRLAVMGHSAGGQIAGRLMGTDWTKLADDLPADLLKGGIPVSPVMDLEPLRFTSLNQALGLDAAAAKAESPINHPPATDAPQLVICGELETPEFHRQVDIYVAAFSSDTRPMARYLVPDCDHFDELNVLASGASDFFRKSLALVNGC